MALFNWLGRKPTETDPTRSAEKATPESKPSDAKAAAHYRNERARLRELLHKLVRESMVKMGVLSSGFQFKVLATDNKGRQFLVLMELAPQLSAALEQFTEIETLIIQTAKARHDITVGAVYWRVQNRNRSDRPAPTSSDNTLSRSVERVAAQTKQPVRHEPVGVDEIRALDNALLASRASTAAAKHAPQAHANILEVVEKRFPNRGPAQLTGEENTEIAETQVMDDDTDNFGPLGPTQYGELR